MDFKIKFEDVLAAYNKIRLKSCIGRFYVQAYGGHCCPLGALYIAENGLNELNDENKGGWDWVHAKFGKDFVSGFWKGFDKSATAYCEEENEGNENGRYIREELEKVMDVYGTNSSTVKSLY